MNSNLYAQNEIGKGHLFYKVIIYLFMFITILQCNTVYYYQENFPLKSIIKFSWIILVFILIFYLFNEYNIYIDSKFFLFVSIFSIFVLVLFVINTINFQFSSVLLIYFIRSIFIIILLYVLIRCHLLNDIFYKFEDMVIFLAIISLVLWALSLFHVPTNSNLLISQSGDVNNGSGGIGTVVNAIPGYFYLQFFAQQGSIHFLGLTLVRNAGMFVEAPFYSSILDIAIFVELFLKRNKKLFSYRLIILIITIFSTTSTNGVIVAIFAIFYSYIVNYKLSAYSYLCIGLTLLLTLSISYFLIIDKANYTNTLSSFNVRSNDLSATLNAWKQHFMVGNGFINTNAIVNHMASWRIINGGNTNVSVGFTTILACGGIILATFYVVPLIISYFISSKIFGFALFTFLLFILENINLFYIFQIILMYIWIQFIYRKGYENRNGIKMGKSIS